MAHKDSSALKLRSHLPSWSASPSDLPPILVAQRSSSPLCGGLELCSTVRCHIPGGQGLNWWAGGSRAAGPGSSLPPIEAQAPSETTLANVTSRAEAVLSGLM